MLASGNTAFEPGALKVDDSRATQPEVSVVCLTYNQEDVIADALEGFFSQETDFPVEVIVVDDCSTDGTPAVLARWADEYGDRMKVIVPEANQGAERCLAQACQAARGTFVALCDGDDYWTDSRKLQKQRDYLLRNPDMRACFHDTEIVQEGQGGWFLAGDYNNTPDGSLRWCAGHAKFVKQDSYTLLDYIPCGFVHSSSMFFRWDASVGFPDWFFDHILGDYTLWALQVGTGSFGFLDETMSVYRRRGASAYDFVDRCDYWDKTREDWVSIDADLANYFTEVVPYPEAAVLCLARMRDDLRKLFIARNTFGSNEELAALARSFAPQIKASYGYDLEVDGGQTDAQLARTVRSVLGFPLADKLKLRRLQRRRP